MASEQSIPLGVENQVTSSKPEISSGQKHSADKLTSELQSSRTIEAALASLKEEVRGLREKIEEFLFCRLFTEGHYKNFGRTGLGAEGKCTKESVDENQTVFSKPTKSSGKKNPADYLLSELKSLGTTRTFSMDENKTVFSKPTKSSGKNHLVGYFLSELKKLSELQKLGTIGIFTSLFEEVRGLQTRIDRSLFKERHHKNLVRTDSDLGAKGQYKKETVDETQAMFSKPNKSSVMKHSADNLPSELKSSRTINEAWTSLLDEVRGLQKKIEGSLFTEKHNKTLTDLEAKGKYSKGIMDETQAMFSEPKNYSRMKHKADNLPSELKSFRSIGESWISLLEEVSVFQKRVEEFQLKSKYTEEFILSWPTVSGQWILDNFLPELESSTFIDSLLASLQKEVSELQTIVEKHVYTVKHDKNLGWTSLGAAGKYTRESVDEAGWLATWLAKQEAPHYGENHLGERTQRLDLENNPEEINELLEKSVKLPEKSVEELQFEFERRLKKSLDEAEWLAEEDAKCSIPQTGPVEPHHYGKSHIVEMTRRTWRLDLENSSKETRKLLDFERRLENLPLRKQHAIYPLPTSCSEDPYFTPRVVSIGPYHHGKTHLAKMECHKHRFVKDFMLRNPGKSFEQYCNELKRIEPEVRKYYFLKVDLTSPSFIEMMLLDGCFILELLIKVYYGISDETFYDNYLSRCIKTELLMFANQIPFKVLVDLHDLANTGSLPCIHQLLVNYFWDTSNGWPMLRSSGSHNILHFYHLQFIPPFVNEHLTNMSSKEKCRAKFNEAFVTQVPSAEQLEKAGVIFRLKRTMKFLEIKFQDGVLEMPTLSLNEQFLLLLVNLAMYEKLNIAVGKVVQTYCSFMHCLLKNPYDVRLLRISGVIEGNSISIEELRDQLDRFQNPDYLNTEKHYFVDLFFDLWEYCEKAEKNANVQEGRVKCFSFFGKAFVVVAVAFLYHIWIQYYL